MSQTVRVALVGQPNVGKSELINAISGASFKVGNFAGVTVEKKEVHVSRGGYEVIITDLPGIYSLNAYAPDEEVTKHFLLQGEYDLIINVIDSNAVSKNLDLTLQLLELDAKVVLCFNMIDEVEKSGGTIDNVTLAKALGVPVMLVSAKEKRGVDALVQKILEMHAFGEANHNLVYDRNIEMALERLCALLEKDEALAPHKRFYALRLLENDKDIYRLIHDKPIFLEFYEVLLHEQAKLGILEAEENHAFVMASARSSIIKFLCSIAVKQPSYDALSRKIDTLLIHKLFGLPLFFAIMWLLFQVTFVIGEIPMAWIEEVFGAFADGVKNALPSGVINQAISEGVIPSIGAVIGFLPNIIILFLGINLLEQTGYMARTAYLLDGIFKRFGLHGKSFIPLVTGFGCSIPAYIATKTLKNPKDKLITMLVISFFSCSARLPVYVLFVSAFFEPENAGNLLFAIYVIGAILGLVAARILRGLIFSGQSEPFVMEMPKYRLPSLLALLKELQIRSILFLKRAGLFIGSASLVIWFLSTYPLDEQGVSVPLEQSYIGSIGRAIEPVFEPLGFDWKMSIAAITGLAAKEVAVGTLAALNSVELEESEPSEGLIAVVRESIDFKAGIAFLILMMVYSPCFAAMGAFFSEVKETKWRLLYLLFPNITAWVLAYSVVHLLAFIGY